MILPLIIFSSDDLKLVRKSEMAFLKETGLKEVLEETYIESVNITEEVLANRTMDDKTVKKIVEKQSPPYLEKNSTISSLRSYITYDLELLLTSPHSKSSSTCARKTCLG